MRRRSNLKSKDGFTMIEVLIASVVLVMVFVGSIGALTIGFRMLEDARFNTLASQVLQSEVENLRLMNWTDLNALPASATIPVNSAFSKATFSKFTCNRKIVSIRTDTRRVVVALSWTSMSGRANTRVYTTYMTKNGLNDYYYTKS